MDRHTGVTAYKAVMKNTLTGRQLEAHVLLETADRLQRVVDTWDSQGHEARLSDAISRTHTLWCVFQDALADADNPMADDVKSNILSLSLFIDRRLFATLADPTPDKLAAVINIHRELAAGLCASCLHSTSE